MSDGKQYSIGFVGVGRMGGAMARNLRAAGHRVTVFDPNPRAVEQCTKAGTAAAQSAADAVADKEIVFTSVPMPHHLLDLYSGARSVTAKLAAGAVCVDVSTIDPTTARAVADELAGHGIEFVACPVGKGPAQAEAGTIPLFTGGPRAVVDRLRPVLAAIGEPVHYLGAVEAATMFKLISNLVGMANLAALAEGFQLAQRAGIPADAFDAALRDTGAHSAQVDMRLGFLAADDHSNRFAVDLAAKDLRLAVDAAARWSQPIPVTSQALQQLVAASAAGWGGEDVTALVKAIRPK
ncbi:NAD(P)-dependent oxidoreductase [Saccharopolyspora phatthalungensis]|uniref:3-hydroxyisobutyrate dehydrogenase n=1 Tax=Saccharopolyspora phatthalungensis TaxID=664693 RepID=A0A840Q578_9PSEU|nr:NAD(P)-dependent oxidoreductase [Saccharopolyspora phatthalungensis]MBB5157662.1 3-hydroxyisobutyrate dehydrogenase [Saccharopolyspora phatthalungensis]